MRQLDVFANPSRASSAVFPYVAVLQSDAVDDTSSVLVAPFAKAERFLSDRRIYPTFNIEGQELSLAMTDVAPLPRSLLRSRPVTNLEGERHRIVKAIDMLFTGV